MASKQAQKIGTDQQSFVGYLTWFSVPSINADYDQLKDLAIQAGLHEDYTPDAPSARDAWRKATNTGKRGFQVPQSILDSWKVREAKDRKEGTPRAFLRTVEISRSAPLLVRHLVLFVVLPEASGKDRQLEVGTVAVLEFDTETSQGTIRVTADDQNWIPWSYVDKVARDMNDRIYDLAYKADNNKVRASMRDMLEDFHRVCVRNTGGVYFVPKSTAHVHTDGTVTTAKDGLDAMKRWTDGMDRYAVNQEEPPMFRRVILEGENAQELRDDILTSAVHEFKDSLQAIAESLEPVFEGRANGRTAEGIAENAVAALGNVMDAARAYRKDLDLDLTELEAMFRMAQSAVVKAQGTVAELNLNRGLDTEDIMALLAD